MLDFDELFKIVNVVTPKSDLKNGIPYNFLMTHLQNADFLSGFITNTIKGGNDVAFMKAVKGCIEGTTELPSDFKDVIKAIAQGDIGGLVKGI